MNIKFIAPALVIAALALASAAGLKAVRADDTGDYPPIIQRLAERFNLNKDELQTFFNEQRQERQQLRQQNREERLNQAVSDGVITEEQKQALLNKWEEMKTEREQHREEMQKWLQEQGIDPAKLVPYGGFGGRGGHWHMLGK